MFEFGEAALDQISQGVEVAVDDWLDLPVARGRDDGGDASGVEVAQDGAGVIAFVAEHDLRLGSGLGHERAISLDV